MFSCDSNSNELFSSGIKNERIMTSVSYWVIDPVVVKKCSNTCRSPVEDFDFQTGLECPGCSDCYSAAAMQHCDMCLEKIHKIVRKKSVLNGNNGSWTNSDDVDHPARIRMRKEAMTTRHRKNGEKTKVQFGPPELPVIGVVVDPPIVIEDELLIITSSTHQYVIDENNVLYRKVGPFTFKSTCGLLILKSRLIAQGMELKGRYSKNCFVYDETCNVVHVTSPLRSSLWKYGVVDGIVQDGFNGVFYQPFMKLISERLPCQGKPTQQRRAIALALCSKDFNYLEELIPSCVEHWDRLQHKISKECLMVTPGKFMVWIQCQLLTINRKWSWLEVYRCLVNLIHILS